MKKRITAVLIGIMILLTGCGAADSGSGGEAGESGDVNFSKFTAADLEGNAVEGSVMGEADLTVLNIWATFCSPCIEEMPGLGELSEEYKGKGVQFIGIPADATTEDLLQTAKEIVSSTGADYLQIAPNQELMDLYLNQVMSVPETLFLDKEGNILQSFVGSRSKSEWKELIEEAYQEVK